MIAKMKGERGRERRYGDRREDEVWREKRRREREKKKRERDGERERADGQRD